MSTMSPTKDVLVDLRDVQFGSDTVRVLKQHRGHSGIGVWRVERPELHC